jgi:hypothetical protein
MYLYSLTDIGLTCTAYPCYVCKVYTSTTNTERSISLLTLFEMEIGETVNDTNGPQACGTGGRLKSSK